MSELQKNFAKRRSIYKLGNHLPISVEELENLIKNAVKYVPSAFNSQSSRVVLLLGKKHLKLWNDITLNILKDIVSEDKFENTKKRISAFAQAYGTILFFEDLDTIKNLEHKFPEYAQNFIVWSNQTSGMLQYMVWTLLAENNIGASLQHYNPLIDNELKKQFAINPKWQLIAQMPFGNIKEEASEKTFLALDERFFTLS